VRIDVATLTMTLVDAWPAGLSRGGGGFVGGVFDGTHVWLVPLEANAVVRIDAATLTMTMINGVACRSLAGRERVLRRCLRRNKCMARAPSGKWGRTH